MKRYSFQRGVGRVLFFIVIGINVLAMVFISVALNRRVVKECMDDGYSYEYCKKL